MNACALATWLAGAIRRVESLPAEAAEDGPAGQPEEEERKVIARYRGHSGVVISIRQRGPFKNIAPSNLTKAGTSPVASQ